MDSDSNALSAQRSDEDSDLLERSTRKRKVDGGSSEIAMTVPVETHPREETVVPSSSTAAARETSTLATDPPASTMHIEEDQRSTAADPGSGTPRTSPIANALPRSYLDSVVGSGSGAAPFLLSSLPEDDVDDSMGDDAGTGDGVAGLGATEAADDHNTAVPPNENPTVTTRGNSVVSCRPKPYGSWMIVTRKDNRQTGRPSGSGRQTDQRGSNSAAGGAGPSQNTSGSRFAPLEEGVEAGLPSSQQNCERRAGKQPAVSGSDVARQPPRPRRPNVIANERQIENDRAMARSTPPTVTDQAPRRQSRGSGSRRAAEEDEHTVIRGELGGQVINSTRVATEEAPTATAEESEVLSQEHHTDPPDGLDMEGDVVMEIEDHNGDNLTEGLIDMGYSGQKFTWVKVLADGCAKSARTTARRTHVGLLSFKFQAAWLTNNGLNEVVHSTWNTHENFSANISRMGEISDNIVVFQEVMHSMRTKRGHTGYMAIKLDFEKAYDRLSWSFVEATLEEAGFNQRWIDLIMNCIRTTRLSINWNGERLPPFNPERGIRQGDAMSPALFVLCLDKLSQLISLKVQSGEWRGIRLAASCPILSQLCFADDTVLFVEASLDQAAIVNDCLSQFCAASGQKISLEKSQFGSNLCNMEGA
nr:Retrovirus-related Pol polyprotein LINE-1 [Ipomoea batatas]